MTIPSPAVEASTGVPPWLTRTPPEPDPDWHHQGACRSDAHPDQWVELPPLRLRGRNNPRYSERLDALKSICATCPVRNACAWEALQADVYGVWGGLDDLDRADLRDLLGLPQPPSLTLLPDDFDRTDPVEATGSGGGRDRSRDAARDQARLTARRLAKQGLSNALIAERLGVTPMTVSRLLDERDQPSRARHSAA